MCINSKVIFISFITTLYNITTIPDKIVPTGTAIELGKYFKEVQDKGGLFPYV
jgi:hypothetical protein